MPLKLVRRHGSPYWYIRGTLKRVRVDESTGTDDKKAAEAFLINRQKEILDRSIHGDTATRTFGEAALGYLKSGGDGEFLAPILKRLGRKKLFEITQGVIEETAEALFKGAGPATQNRKVYTPISAVLHYAARQKWCSKPVIARPRQPKGRIRAITNAEALRLLEAASPHMKPLVLFLLSTGCRISEALYLDWTDVDLDAGEVTFRDTKNGEDRVVPLAPEVLAAFSTVANKTGAVFRTQKGLPYEDREGGGGQVKTAWAGMCKRAKIDNFTPHDCRHTFATWYLKKFRKDYVGLMKVCGWKSMAMVMRYAHLEVEDVRPNVSEIWGQSGDTKPAMLNVVENKDKLAK